MSPPVVFRTIREQIANRLRQELLSGQFTSGEPLRETQLAARFGVSRGPIRDALLQLTQEGLLVAQANCGVRVKEAPSKAIQPLVVALRRMIEKFALDSVWDTLTDEDIRNWEDLTEQLHEACRKKDAARVIELDMAFHRSIVERTGDRDLAAMWLPIITRMLLVYSRHRDWMDVYREHSAVVREIRNRDRAAALAALEANIV